MTTNLKAAARGQWKQILPSFGINAEVLVNKHGPCPICRGKDRFRFDDQYGDGGFICNQCGAGDGFALAQRVSGKPFHEIAKVMEDMLGLDHSYQPKQINRDEQDKYNAIRRAWEGARTPVLDGPVDRYLTRRVGCLWPSNAIREYVRKPAMLAKIVTHTDKAVNIHITLLDLDGNKAKVEPSKKVMPGKLPDGCAIRLGPAKARMGVAEGIETAISAALMFDMPVWACVNGTLLAKWIPPEVAEEVFVFGDNDMNFTGQAKAYHLANRLEVQYKRKVEVKIPSVTGEDWNDTFVREANNPRPRLSVVK
jgi:putative DNA primase/helicase